MLTLQRPLTIDELTANHYMVSVHKYGFFLCRGGAARIILGSSTYNISRNYLCFYAPNTFFQILEKSDDLSGVLEEGSVDAYYPVISSIDIRRRLQVRNSPCVKVVDEAADEIQRLYDLIRENEGPVSDKADLQDAHRDFFESCRTDCIRYLRYALCVKVLEAYFGNTPADALPQSHEDNILNSFLVSVYENCHQRRAVQFYADEQHLSPYYFSSIIRSVSGKTALQWIADIVMTFARQYLECSELSIKEIANRMNFPDQSTFCRFFKRHEGRSPTDFRKLR